MQLRIDPKRVKYPGTSSYLSMGGNPLYFIDTKDDIITVSGSPHNKKAFLEKINE